MSSKISPFDCCLIVGWRCVAQGWFLKILLPPSLQLTDLSTCCDIPSSSSLIAEPLSRSRIVRKQDDRVAWALGSNTVTKFWLSCASEANCIGVWLSTWLCWFLCKMKYTEISGLGLGLSAMYFTFARTRDLGRICRCICCSCMSHSVIDLHTD